MARKNAILKIVVELSRIIIGATFLFSGFVKAVDPLGTTYKIQDYLISFNLTEWFPLALPAAISMVVFEFLIGVFILLGIYRRFWTIAAALFMAFFLPLTLWIALYNPVKDCGCFGDAFILSNWETFYKNIILSFCAISLLIYWRQMPPLFSKKTAWISAAFSILFSLTFPIYNLTILPVFDFRPYKIGANIPANRYVDPAKSDVYENIFIYSKDGRQKEFTEQNYPWNDSTWTFVDIRTKLIKEGDKPKIEDFLIESLTRDSLENSLINSGDITEALLSDENYNFLMIAYSLNKMKTKYLDDFKSISKLASEKGYGFYCITSSSSDDILRWSKQHDADFDFCHADERMLKTMIRSNPGLILLKNGIVINKWSDSHLPRLSGVKADNFDKATTPRKNSSGLLIAIILLFSIPLLIIKIVDMKMQKSIRKNNNL